MGKPFNSDNMVSIPLENIVVPEGRQRKVIKDTDEMALSIRTVGLLHPIVVRPSDKAGFYFLVAGERRFRAYELLVVQGHQGYGSIPCHMFDNISESEAQLIELEENVKRQDIDWKDQAIAVSKMITAYQQRFEDWPLQKIAEYIGYDYSGILKIMHVAKALIAQNPQVQAASGLKAAIGVLEREKERKQTAALDKLEEDVLCDVDIPAPTPLPTGAFPSAPNIPAMTAPARPISASIMQGNFEEWSETYAGPKFNFIHCDFPYGLDHDESEQGGAKTWGAYADSEEVYWRLCGTLLRNRDRLMLRSCHIMFWFSMKYYTETLAFFRKHAPEIEVQDFPLIWHKSDNKGIAPDHTRQPRRVYETALVMSRNDRKTCKMVSNCISAPTNKADAIHISEKPVPVLNHFFSMFCDSTTRVLDPTCGGGTSIRAADGMGVEAALGIELDELYASAAQKKLKGAQGLAALSEKVGAA